MIFIERRHNVKEIHLSVDDIKGFDNDSYSGFKIYWSSDIGFGEYTIWTEMEDGELKLYGDSEHMDSNDDKEFVTELMRLVVNKLIISG